MTPQHGPYPLSLSLSGTSLEAHVRRSCISSSLIPLQNVQSKRGEARIAQNRAVLPQKPGTARKGLLTGGLFFGLFYCLFHPVYSSRKSGGVVCQRLQVGQQS